jgi:hypothetical protein
VPLEGLGKLKKIQWAIVGLEELGKLKKFNDLIKTPETFQCLNQLLPNVSIRYGILFIYEMKSNGPKTEPKGTPYLVGLLTNDCLLCVPFLLIVMFVRWDLNILCGILQTTDCYLSIKKGIL